MIRFQFTAVLSSALGLLAPIAVNAEVLSSTNPTIRNSLCIGFGCLDDEGPQSHELQLKANNLSLDFLDNSTIAGLPDGDWRIVINDTFNGGQDYFAIEDVTSSRTPFRVDGGAPTNAMRVSSNGALGLGTSLPQQHLHIISDTEAGIRFEDTLGSSQTWDLRGNDFGFYLYDPDALTIPFEVRAGAPDGAVFIATDGSTGIGTRNPQELLHIRTDAADTDAFALFDANGPGSDSSFRLRQNGITPTTWEFRNQQDSGRLNVGLAGGNTPFKIDNAANNNLLKLGRNGRPDEVVVTGKLIVNDTQLNVPDYVFADDYPLKSLVEVDHFIAENGHLPGVPSASDVADEGLDMTQMQMVQLEKIEELTLHTISQDKQLAAQQDEIKQLRAMVETLLADR